MEWWFVCLVFLAKLSLKNPQELWILMVQPKFYKKETKPQTTLLSHFHPSITCHNFYLHLYTFSHTWFLHWFFFFHQQGTFPHFVAGCGLVRFSATLLIQWHFSKSCTLYIANGKRWWNHRKELNVIHGIPKEKMEQWITLIPANTIILNSFKFKSNLLSISSQRATNIYLPCASRANRSRVGACCLQKGLPLTNPWRGQGGEPTLLF